MTANSLLMDMRLSYNQFTKTEKKIADFVMGNVNRVLFMSITDLADACKVADASVHRFCRTVGVKGYQEFKMKLSLGIAATEPDKDLDKSGEAAPSLSGIFDRVLESHITALKDTRMLLDMKAVEKAVDMMEKARNIYFFGIGNSMLTAQEARNKFLRVINKVNCISDPHMQAMSVAMSDSDDLIFIVSYSGSTKDSIYVAEIARKSGAGIIGITRFLKSPLTNYTDVILTCGANEGPLEGGSMGAKISQLYIIDILFQEYCRRNPEISGENNRKTSRAVVEKLY